MYGADLRLYSLDRRQLTERRASAYRCLPVIVPRRDGQTELTLAASYIPR